MTRTEYRLTLALALSLLLHLAPFLQNLLASAPTPVPPPPALQAELRIPASFPAPIPLALSEAEPPKTSGKAKLPAKTVLTAAGGKRSWQEEIRQQFRQQHQRQEFYPLAAIAQGIEGEALVLLILDASGQVAAARIEQSSGQHLLDDAALRAVRALHSLPADAPRETLLPVRFRLH